MLKDILENKDEFDLLIIDLSLTDAMRHCRLAPTELIELNEESKPKYFFRNKQNFH